MWRATFFLDEIQLVPGWELFARRLLDSENIELFLSGSSARLLSREVATSMRGRAMEAIVSPFSFREALRHASREPSKSPARLTKAERSLLDRDLLDYLADGGFPEAQGLDTRNRFELLRTYEVMTPGSALESFSRTWGQLESGENVVPRLAFGSLKELFSAITQKRLEMVRFVAGHGEMNTRQLSQQLGRNYKYVYQDVKALVELGLLDKNEEGGLTAPFDEIVIHAPVRDAA